MGLYGGTARLDALRRELHRAPQLEPFDRSGWTKGHSGEAASQTNITATFCPDAIRLENGVSTFLVATADASGIVTHTLDLGGGILLRPRRFRPRASVLDCSGIRCDCGNCERVLQLDPRKPPPVPCRRMPRYVAVGSSPLDGETPVSEASRANPEFRRGTVLGNRSAATK